MYLENAKDLCQLYQSEINKIKIEKEIRDEIRKVIERIYHLEEALNNRIAELEKAIYRIK